MTLEEEIKDLERQRADHLRDATYLFARTKRDLRRKLSPDRMVRKNIGVAIVAAAVGAMLLAPGPRREKIEKTSVAADIPGGRSGWRATLGGLVPERWRKLAGLAGEQQPANNGQPTEQKRTKSLLELLITELALMAARQVNWNALLQHLMQRFSPATHNNGSEEEPRVAVANVGTTPSDQVLDGKVKAAKS